MKTCFDCRSDGLRNFCLLANAAEPGARQSDQVHGLWSPPARDGAGKFGGNVGFCGRNAGASKPTMVRARAPDPEIPLVIARTNRNLGTEPSTAAPSLWCGAFHELDPHVAPGYRG